MEIQKFRKPISITSFGRIHFVDTWKMADFEMLEDLFAKDESSVEKLVEKPVINSEKPIVKRNQEGECWKFSNGFYFPNNYMEYEYALACIEICKICGITPFDMSIEFAENLDGIEPAAAKNMVSDTVNSEEIFCENISEIEAEDSTLTVQDEEEIKNFSEEYNSQYLPAESSQKYNISEADAMWTKVLCPTVSNVFDSQSFNISEWDEIIGEYDGYISEIAKEMKKSGIKPPVTNSMYRLCQGKYKKIVAEALFVWPEEKVVYLHGNQKYSKLAIYETGHFTEIFVDDLQGLIKYMKENGGCINE